jgi:ABC-type uncharacterized transport system fused permease/ATPase subunit
MLRASMISSQVSLVDMSCCSCRCTARSQASFTVLDVVCKMCVRWSCLLELLLKTNAKAHMQSTHAITIMRLILMYVKLSTWSSMFMVGRKLVHIYFDSYKVWWHTTLSCTVSSVNLIE